ncbi:MAG: hypothetical protein P4L87_11835, partial [Formivibrio sp.]|nr:hypothetical protein [Formivibrio sp.]
SRTKAQKASFRLHVRELRRYAGPDAQKASASRLRLTGIIAFDFHYSCPGASGLRLSSIDPGRHFV